MAAGEDGMSRYIAFLRGINVGGHRVRMERLRELFEQLDLTDVATFIASGNVTFTADPADPAALTATIERHLARELGYEVPTFLRSPAQLAQIVAHGVSHADVAAEEAADPERSVYVVLLPAPATERQRANFEALATKTDEFVVAETEIYWLIRGKLSESPLFDRGLDEALDGAPVTMRNMNTLRRIASRLGAISLVSMLLFSGCSDRRVPAPGGQQEFSEADRAHVVRAVESGVRAFHSADTARDAEAVIDLLWPEYAMLVDGKRIGYAEVVAGSREFMGRLTLFHTEWTDLEIVPLSRDAAVSSFLFRDSIVTNQGEMIRARGTTTFVWQRRQGEWRIVFGDADHYPVDP